MWYPHIFGAWTHPPANFGRDLRALSGPIRYRLQLASRRIARFCSSFGARIEPRFGDRLIVINQYRSRNLALEILLPIAETRYSKTVSRANMPPASSPLRPAAPRPGASRSAPLAAIRGVVNSPEASGASSVARRAERPRPSMPSWPLRWSRW